MQLASLVAAVPSGSDWLHEIKYDGYRIVAIRSGGRVRLLTRNGKDWTGRFAGIAEAVSSLPCRQAVLDGEAAVVGRGGVTSFQALQNALRRGMGSVVYFAFDLLELDGADLREYSLEERKSRLESLLAASSDPLRYSEHVVGRGVRFFEQACRHGLEGIISKRRDAPYRVGRGREWLKVKCVQHQEFAIVGYTDPGGSRVGFGALLLGVRSDGDGGFRYVGRVGTGFSDAVLRSLHGRLRRDRVSRPTVSNAPPGAAVRGVHWVEPKLVAAVSFTEWTDAGLLRHPSFLGLREDKPASEVRLERPVAIARDTGMARGRGTRTRGGGGMGQAEVPARRSGGGERKAAGRSRRAETAEVAGVRLTNPHRILYASQGITKLDLARYYEEVADWMLPHVADRPLTLVRCPAGREGECFYQKHIDESADRSIQRVAVEPGTGAQPYGAVRTTAGLVALVQMGVLEIHTWGSKRDRLEQPDRLTFDLDPDEGLEWTRVVAAAFEVREFLESLGLHCLLKTTGGKGLHVVTPIRRKDDWDVTKEFARAVASAIASDAPGRYTTNVSKAKRKGRILIDYLRNGRGATAVEAYSTRARAGAPVATPIRWEELGPKMKPDRFSVRNLPRRLASLRADPWEDYPVRPPSVTVGMKKAVGMK